MIAILFPLNAVRASEVVYTIDAQEALAGPKPSNPNILFSARPPEGGAGEASVTVDAAKVRGHVNPMVYGACFEDLNHEIYGGLYAQMIFGESFEEGPEKELPKGWRLQADYLKLPIWQGMWCSENGAIGMTGARFYKFLWNDARFEDGTIECDLMQPSFDPNRPIGLMFRAGGQEFRDSYTVTLDARRQRLELMVGDRSVAGGQVTVRPDEWLHLRVEVKGGQIRVFAGRDDKPVIDFTDPNPLPPGLVGFDATESHGWFRGLKIVTGGQTYVPPMTPDRPADYRGPVSQWWDSVMTGNADVAYGWDADRPFNTLRSQRIELRSGSGTAGVANRGVHRFGLSFIKGRTYEGRLYLRGAYTGAMTVALQSADGSKTYSTQKLTGIGADWKKFPFRFTANATDDNGRFAVWIDKPGKIWVDQVVLMPTSGDLFKGLPERADIANAVVESGVTCIRLGGDYSGVPGFKWKTMLGDPDRRPQYNSCWYPFESRGWSIIEFMAFCRAAGIEPIPCINPDETPQDVADLVEFCNGPATSKWGRERVAMGYPKPFGLKYIQLGNGCPPLDHLAAVADAMHAVDPAIKLLTGSIGHVETVLPDKARQQEIREKLGGKVHAVAMFPYNSEVTGPTEWQAMLDRLEPLRGHLKVYSQEVNGGNHNLLRGLTDAGFCNVTERNSDFVDVVTYCGMVQADKTDEDNGWSQGRIFFNNHQVWLQPHAWTIRMAREHYQPVALETKAVSAKMTFKDPIPYGVPEVDTINASAARSEDGKRIELKVVNFAPFAQKTAIRIVGTGKLMSKAELVQLTGGDLMTENTAAEPERIKPVSSVIKGAGNDFSCLLPAYSYSIISLCKE